MTRRALLATPLAVVAAAAALAPAPAPAQAVPCAAVAAYPGDSAAQPAIAQWLAYGASLRATPRELPVMGALVASGLKNLAYGDADEVGYFQMRLSIWNGGEYHGYLENPSLQLKWFLDQAEQARATQIAAGRTDPALDESRWGDWVADVLRPAEQYRYRYQLRLADARALIGPPCTPAASGTAPAPGTVPAAPRPAADVTAPALRLAGARVQRALRAGALVVDARCPAEACTMSATASIVLPGARRALRIALRSRALAAGQARRLRFVLDRGSRRRMRAALRSRASLKATVRVVATDAAGNRASDARTVRVTG